MVGVSLTTAIFLVLMQKSLLLKCFAVLLLGFFCKQRIATQKYFVYFKGIFCS